MLFRFLGANDQSIALTVDGGMTARKPVTVNGYFTSYVRLAERDDPDRRDGRLLDGAAACSARAIRERRSSAVPRPAVDPRAVAAQRAGLRGHRQLRRRLRARDVGGRRDDVAGADVLRRREGDQPVPQGAVPGDLRRRGRAVAVARRGVLRRSAAGPRERAAAAARAGRSGAVGPAAAARAARRRPRKRAAATSRRRRAHRRWASCCSGCCSSRLWRRAARPTS